MNIVLCVLVVVVFAAAANINETAIVAGWLMRRLRIWYRRRCVLRMAPELTGIYFSSYGDIERIAFGDNIVDAWPEFPE